MHSAATGYRKGSTSATRCIDIAGLIAAAMIRQNPDALVLPFEAKVQEVRVNPRDSVMTNAEKLASLPCGGTNCSAPLQWIADKREPVDIVVIVSDNESWIDSPHYGHWGGGPTETLKQWQRIKKQSPTAKLVCLDIQPNTHTQAKNRPDIINIGGFSDRVFDLISAFAEGKLEGGLADQIRTIPIKTRMNKQSA
jgi:60 kDa SS-A/Ro ribonucleoprotein